MNRICVFCGSNEGDSEVYRGAAEELAGLLVRENIELVYGGAQVGLMGRIADAVLQGGGRVTGIIPGALFPKEIPHQGLTQLLVVDSMHERKRLMYEFSDGFIALPGGLGTLDELFEILTWGQLGLHGKPCGLLNVAGYFDEVLAFLATAENRKFLKPQHRKLLLDDADPKALLAKMRDFQPHPLKKWIRSQET
ncbi:MAG: TIGR00730 family Rossman fold protein [Deltaproteobacteria bacterium]|nr:TIGR00730 family Rossman fold protein [Deltaproteobacteria bacterium]